MHRKVFVLSFFLRPTGFCGIKCMMKHRYETHGNSVTCLLNQTGNLKGCFNKILFHKVNGVCIDFTHGAVMFYTTLLVSVEINIIQIYNSIHYLLYIVYFQAKRD